MTFPAIDPVLLSLGPLQIRWYGLMYVIGFCISYVLVQKQIKRHNLTSLAAQFDNLNFLLILSVIVGGRLGYVFFYNFSYFMHHPAEILATWHGGMSFHGACILLITNGFLFCKIKKIDFWTTADCYIVTVPVGLFLGRLGNFINGELYGRITELPVGIIFPAGGPLPRHPSQLYQAFLEGLVLFCILWALRKKPYQKNASLPHGSMLCLFLICYGIFRFIVEFFREPDIQVGYIGSYFTLGQLLCAVMVITGVLLYIFLQRRRAAGSH
ncbi:MAG: prolipoprotein diacylglyceryl transferase [Desulfobacterales bacterium]|nr:MAG: prolipoprotein diacylglyceryl transferase [Desulfobacterales bacterium]